MENWAIYARCSTEEQAKEGHSIEMQVSNCKELINNIPEANLYKIYKDEGISGSDSYLKRPGLLSLLSDIKDKKINGIALYKADRLTRLSKEQEELIFLLLKHNIKVKCHSGEELTDSTPQGEFIRRTFANLSELEVKILSFRIKSAMKLKAQKGEWKGSRPPYGYEWNKKEKIMIPIEEKIKQVKLIFKLYIEKLMGFNKIRDYLNENKILYIKDNERSYWTKDRIRNIINSPLYCGYQWHNTRYSKFEIRDGKKFKNKNEWELYPINYIKPIISKEQWDKSQEIKNKRVKKLLTTNTSKTTWLLTGILYCGCCGKPMQGHPIINKKKMKNGEIKKYDCSNYICTGRTSKGNNHCNSTQVVKKEVEKVILNETLNYIDNIINIYDEDYIKRNVYNIYNDNKDINEIKKKIKQIKSKINKYYQDYENDKIDADILTPAIKRLNKELEEYKQEEEIFLEKSNNQKKIINKVISNISTIKDWKLELLNSENISSKKVILLNLISYVEVINVNRTIYYNFEFIAPEEM